MAYSITTKDGITINNIPDDVAPDSSDLKARVASIRAGGGAAALDPPAPTEQPKMGFFEGIAESVTGRARATPETQALPEWTGMPELNQMSVASFKTALGTLMSNPKETVQILQANFPGVGVRQDEKGNFILRSSVDQKEYAIPPGFTIGDVPKAVGALAAFTPAGRAATIPGAILGAGATQAVIEGTQAATGGEISPSEIALAAATGPAGQILQRVAPPVVQTVKNVAQRVTGRPAAAPAPAVAPGAPMGAAMAPKTQPIATAPQVAASIPEEVSVAVTIKETPTYLMAETPTGKVGGVKTPDGLKINFAEVEEAARGKGDGLKLYQALVDPILEKGKTVSSDSTVEALAVRVYEALERRGYKIERNIAGILDDGSVYGPGAQAPAFKIVGKPSVAPPVAPVVAEVTQESVNDLVQKAAGTGFGSAGARDRLADLAQVNVAAKEAADRLGIQLPADVFSDNPQVRAAAGLTRSVAGGEAEAAWRNTVTQAVDKADDVIKQFDATFVEGAVAPGVVSQKIKDSLTATRSDLNTQAGKVYDAVDEVVPKTSIVDLPKLKATLDAIKAEVTEEGMSAAERKLANMIERGNVTYGLLKREKGLIGKALNNMESPYGSMAEADLKRLYAALADDQLTNVGNIGGEELRQQLRAANLIYAKERALGKRIVNAFGQDIEGSVANKMRTAITGAAKGDAGEFNRLLKTVPEDLRKETLATALASVTRSARGAEKGGFGFSEFADIYPKLRANPPVYKTIVDTLGKDSANVLRDLFEVSKRVTEARANVLTTGKANQAFANAEGLIGKVMESSITQRAATAAAGLVPGGGLVAPDIIQFMSKSSAERIKAAGKLFADDGFQKLAIEAATKGTPSANSIRRTAMSQSFQNFADAAKIPKALDARIQWLQTATQAERQFDQENQ
jgi:hypothetical protein